MSDLEPRLDPIDDRGEKSLPFKPQSLAADDRFEQFKATSSALFSRSTALIVFPRRWLRNGLVATAIGLATAGGAWFYFGRQVAAPIATKSSPPPLSVSTLVATSQAIVSRQTVTGTVEPGEVVTTTSRVAGQITSLPVKAGDRVNAGQVLAKIDDRDLTAREHQAAAAIAQAISGVNTAQSALTQAVASQTQLVAQIDRSRSLQQQAQAQYRQASAQKKSVQSELNNARLTQQRLVTLQSAGAIGRSNLDAINTDVAILKSHLQQSTETISQAKADIAQASASIIRLQASQAQAHALVNQSIAIVSQAQAQVRRAEAGKSQAIANLRNGIVTAPFSGVVTYTYARVGAIASTGQSLVTVENTARQRFSIDVPESARWQIKPGTLARIGIEGIPTLIQGRVERVMPSANPNSQNFTAKIALPPTTSLRSGMLGRLTLEGVVHQGIKIPAAAIVRRGQQAGVYVVDVNARALFRWVRGTTQDGIAEIVSGLSSGDRVVTSSLERIQDGQSVSWSNPQ